MMEFGVFYFPEEVKKLRFHNQNPYERRPNVLNESIVSPLIGHCPSHAYDRHTHTGKSAFRHFLKSYSPVSKFLFKHLPDADKVDLIGWALFSVEGRLLNKRMIYDGSETLLEHAIETWIQKAPDYSATRFTTLNMEALHDARRSVAGK